MNNPESGRSPEQESEVISPMDEALDAYSQVLHDIEAHGPSEDRTAQRESLENTIRELRALEPGVEGILADSNEAGIKIADTRDATNNVKKEFRIAQKEGMITAAERKEEIQQRTNTDRSPSPEEANNAILQEVSAKVANDDERGARAEVTENDPEELAKTISELDYKLQFLLNEMEADVMAQHPGDPEYLSHLSKDAKKFRKLIDRNRTSYQFDIDKMLQEHAGTDITLPETLRDIPVEKLKDIVFAIGQRLHLLEEVQKDFRERHPHQE